MSELILSEIVPGLDVISTFFTVVYLGWLLTREFRISWTATTEGTPFIKRSLLNQHVYR
jgi:hypothetical protein